MVNPDDPDVLLALGVLYFIARNFDMALESFTHALELSPENHSLLNKIGATLANRGQNPDAIDKYQEALDRNPFYVRVWVNIGIAYSNLKEYDKAARFYLCALSLNPEADHVWNYLNTAFLYMNRGDLIEKLYATRDPEAFRDEFHVVTAADLPKGNWVEEFE
jgi:peroxin-5